MVYSQPGEGTTFDLYFPVTTKEIVKNNKEMGSILFGSGESILLIDDEIDIIETTKIQFERLGYTVFTALNGAEAINTCKRRKGKIDLVLLDLTLPDMAGIDTYFQLKSIQPSIKTVVITGSSLDDTKVKQMINLGENWIIVKPWNFEELINLVHNILHDKVAQL